MLKHKLITFTWNNQNVYHISKFKFNQIEIILKLYNHNDQIYKINNKNINKIN